MPFRSQRHGELHGQTPITRWLDTDGDGTGTKVATGDYSSSAQIFYIAPPANQTYRLITMTVFICDDGAYQGAKYGAANALTNGIVSRVRNSGGDVLANLTDGLPVKSNSEWSALYGNVQRFNWSQEENGGGDALAIRFNFRECGIPIELSGNNGEKLEMVLNDDFSALDDHRFYVVGYLA